MPLSKEMKKNAVDKIYSPNCFELLDCKKKKKKQESTY